MWQVILLTVFLIGMAYNIYMAYGFRENADKDYIFKNSNELLVLKNGEVQYRSKEFKSKDGFCKYKFYQHIWCSFSPLILIGAVLLVIVLKLGSFLILAIILYLVIHTLVQTKIIYDLCKNK